MSDMHTSSRSGFALSDLLLTMMIVSMLIPGVMLSISVMQRTLHKDETMQDMIAEYQLREILLCSYDIHLENNTLCFENKNKEMRLSCKNNHVILQPGTRIFFSDIDNAVFYEDGNVWMIRYEREGKTIEKALIPGA